MHPWCWDHGSTRHSDMRSACWYSSAGLPNLCQDIVLTARKHLHITVHHHFPVPTHGLLALLHRRKLAEPFSGGPAPKVPADEDANDGKTLKEGEDHVLVHLEGEPPQLHAGHARRPENCILALHAHNGAVGSGSVKLGLAYYKHLNPAIAQSLFVQFRLGSGGVVLRLHHCESFPRGPAIWPVYDVYTMGLHFEIGKERPDVVDSNRVWQPSHLHYTLVI
mmetsp:Transcript_22091/g.32069  ORF Transcript_22091/g.32069 Transcript_22091/m.32069 type:complete len:221 (-) Transcript_22091:492-1154(-)